MANWALLGRLSILPSLNTAWLTTWEVFAVIPSSFRFSQGESIQLLDQHCAFHLHSRGCLLNYVAAGGGFTGPGRAYGQLL